MLVAPPIVLEDLNVVVTQGALTEATLGSHEDVAIKFEVVLRHLAKGLTSRLIIALPSSPDPEEFCRSVCETFTRWELVRSEVVWSDSL